MSIGMKGEELMMRAAGLLLGVLVLLASATAGLAQTPEQRGAIVHSDVFAQLADSPDGRAYVVVLLRPLLTLPTQAEVQDVQNRVLAALAVDEFEVVYQYRNFAAMTGHVNGAGLVKLETSPDVIAIGPDARGEGHLDVSVPFINADDVHALGYTGEGITVAVLDTGIDSDHPDLSDNVAAGWYHFLDGGATQGPGAEDDHGHGTNVSGIITSKGVVASVGVAPDADILAIKVLDSTASGWVSDWAAGVDYVVTHKSDYDNLCVINMSLGTNALYTDCPCNASDTWTQLLHASTQAAKNAGIVTFASSGNQGSCTSMPSPACLSSAVAVAAVYDQNLGREPNSGTYLDAYGGSWADCYDATTAGDKITCFSNRLDDCNQLAAPGRLITAPGMGGGVSTYTGTSQAAPHCAGVAALMYEKAGGCIPPNATVAIMKVTGVPTDDPCSTTPNPRRVDALGAVSAINKAGPAVSEWGLILMTLLLLTAAGILVVRPRSRFRKAV